MHNTPPTPADDRSSGDKIGVLDLFAGAGGLSLGFQQGSNRYATVRAVEMDVAAAATYAQNFGPVVYAGDIRRWLQDEPTPCAEVVLGGPPCQGFSTLGKQDPEDLRNTLWRPYAEVVRRAMPRAFVMENVPAFLKSGEYSAFLEAFAGGELADYDIRAEILNAADFGAPQVRKRVIVIGVRRDIDHPGHPTATAGERTTVREALQGIRPFTGDLSLPPRRTPFGRAWLPGPFKGPDLHITRDWSPLYQQRFRAVLRGEPARPARRAQHGLLAEQPAQRERRNGPARVGTAVGHHRTEFFKPEKGRFLHPTQHRAITHWEAARLQGFPDDYRWVGDRAQIARQIGNAVPIRLGEALGSHLAKAL